LENIQALSGQFESGLAAFASHPHVGEVRTAGWMGALEIVENKETSTPFPAALRVSERIANAALDVGLICRPLGQAIVICPPFIMTTHEVHTMFSMLADTLECVFDPLTGSSQM
jgi:adenosylmethionine-8-amino-7-oxononanoate aminotransferase